MSHASEGDIAYRAMTPDEFRRIEAVQAEAFRRDEEALLVRAILEDQPQTLSLVATLGDRIVGHALFPALGGAERALALAPVGVVSGCQRRGVGSGLIRFGLGLAAAQGWRSVFVLGEPEFYARFGFRADLASKAIVPWAGPFFQALELVPGSLAGWSGPLRYPRAFGSME